jgi:hypothetical protein
MSWFSSSSNSTGKKINTDNAFNKIKNAKQYALEKRKEIKDANPNSYQTEPTYIQLKNESSSMNRLWYYLSYRENPNSSISLDEIQSIFESNETNIQTIMSTYEKSEQYNKDMVVINFYDSHGNRIQKGGNRKSKRRRNRKSKTRRRKN